jgi:aromatic ring-opening dioxygenase LigB subunit
MGKNSDKQVSIWRLAFLKLYLQVVVLLQECISFNDSNILMIVFSAIVPHPPVSIPGIGHAEDFLLLKKTLQSYEILRQGLEETNPDVIIMISPHGKMEPYSFGINSSSELVGGFQLFSLDKSLSFKNEIDIVDKIFNAAQQNEIPAHLYEGFLDHGSLIPLYHLTKNIHPSLVHLSFSLMSYQRHYRYGEIIKNIIDKNGSYRVAVIASGDLSHRINKNSQAGYSPNAADFDKNVIRYLGSRDIASILGMEENVIEEAAECGMRSIMIMLGVLGNQEYDFKLLSYEHPYGIGHLTARLI